MVASIQQPERRSLVERKKVLTKWLLDNHLAHPDNGVVEWRECENCHNPYPTWRVESRMKCCNCMNKKPNLITRVRQTLRKIWF